MIGISKLLKEQNIPFLKNDKSFINFINVSKQFPKRKTKTFNLVTKSSMWQLGVIKWDTGWRRYTFEPIEAYSSKFSSGCLRDIANFIDNLMGDRLMERKEK